MRGLVSFNQKTITQTFALVPDGVGVKRNERLSLECPTVGSWEAGIFVQLEVFPKTSCKAGLVRSDLGSVQFHKPILGVQICAKVWVNFYEQLAVG